MWIVFLLLWAGVTCITLPPRECVRNENVTCFCEGEETLRCKEGNLTSFDVISEAIQGLPNKLQIKFLECKVNKIERISTPILEKVPLTDLVISSSGLRNIEQDAFLGLARTLRALGLPGNQLQSVPTKALSKLPFLIKLDLSTNSIYYLDDGSFKDCPSLEGLDLSNNYISSLIGNPFATLKNLNNLILQGNNISNPSLPSFRSLENLTALILSKNELSGPLTPNFLPELPRMLILNFEKNKLTNVTRGALKGVPSLYNLNLASNSIDVIEDFAFESICNLSSLDLSHNTIITISENSLACLDHLEELDLSHNSLITISQDLMLPLKSIKKLSLDYNDIARAEEDVMNNASNLKIFSVKGNPFDCGCSLKTFVAWLESVEIPSSSKETAVCRTPPDLENAVIFSSVKSQTLCDSSKQGLKLVDEVPTEDKSISLKELNYDGNTLWLQWSVEHSKNYKCFRLLFVAHHGLEKAEYNCTMLFLEEPNLISVTVQNPSIIQGGNYEFCIVLQKLKNESSQIYGCGMSLNLKIKIEPKLYQVKVKELPENSLSIRAQVWPEGLECLVQIEVKYKRDPIKVANIGCNETSALLTSLPVSGPYHVCLSVDLSKPGAISCFSSRLVASGSLHPLEKMIAISTIVLVGVSCVCMIFYVVRNIISRRLRERNIQPMRSQVPMKTLYRRLENPTTAY